MTIGNRMAAVLGMAILAVGTLEAAQGRSLFAMAPGPAPAMAPMSAPVFYAQPKLPYDFAALEPYIDAQTVQLHFTKHTATYFANLNAAVVPYPALQGSSLQYLLGAVNTSQIPANITKAVRNNAGGAWNHLLYFRTLQPATSLTNASMNSVLPGPLSEAIDAAFGNYSAYKAKHTEAGLGVFGSGFAFLTYNPKNGSLAIESTPNQDNPLMTGLGYSGNLPILALDVWEHAYYKKYSNVRADYIKAWWMVVDWANVNANYQAAKNGDLYTLTAL